MRTIEVTESIEESEQVQEFIELKNLIDTAQTPPQKKCIINTAAALLNKWAPGRFDFRNAAHKDPEGSLASLSDILGEWIANPA